MTEYKHIIEFNGIKVYIPIELADGGDDEAIKEYIRDYVKSHVHCQRLADELIPEQGMAESFARLGDSRQHWVNINADSAAFTRVKGMPEIEMTLKRKEE